jgi:hypothetical protein
VIALFGCMVECAAAPAQKNVTAPMPPPRPAELPQQEQLQPPNPRGTDARDTQRAPAETNPTTPSDATRTLPLQRSDAVFPALPAASRARMRDCGREWQEMKRTGQAKELTWRDFATKCLTR